MIPRILIIAGSDSGGGAGIQADIKTVTMLGGHAMTAITAITAQNTLGVSAVHPIPTEMVLAQIDAVVEDIGVDAVKIGMIGSAETANAVAERLECFDGVPVVFDPVMVASSGAALADDPTVAAFGRLMRIATVATPNRPELQALAGENGARSLVERFGCAVLAKGGHSEGRRVVDELLLPGGYSERWDDARIETRHGHGTGCTLATAIAFWLAAGATSNDAVARARTFVRIAMFDAPGIGGGHGPMGHAKVRLDGGRGAVLNQITLPVSDYSGSVEFYRLLGLRQIVDSPPRYARFEAPGGATLSIHAEPGARPGPTTIYFECDDLDARVAALETQGVVFDEQPVDRDWLWREARLRDPFGNRICLYRAGENRRFPPWRIDRGVA